MTTDSLLSRLEAVRKTGPGRWIARCPAHEDRHASLSIRETEDGRILIHDFAGCATADVLAAIGLSMAELFPDAPTTSGRRPRRPYVAMDVLRCLSFEVAVVAVAAGAILAGNPLSMADRERLTVAISRIRAAVDIANG